MENSRQHPGQELPTIRGALQQAVTLLQHSESPRLDAEILLCHVLGWTRARLFAHPEKLLTPAERARFDDALQRRNRGEPIAYITGRRAFWTFELEVNESVLIPRPETELLVERALDRPDLPDAAQVADLGTGSGAIALALASERPGWRLVASDFSAEALRVASANAQRLGLGNVCFVQGDWCQALAAAEYDMLVSNPPYVAAGDRHLQQGDLRFEPQTALMAAEEGLADIRRIAVQAVRCLKPGGWLLFEHGHEQGEAVRAVLQGQDFQEIATHRDLAGHERVTLGQKPRQPEGARADG